MNLDDSKRARHLRVEMTVSRFAMMRADADLNNVVQTGMKSRLFIEHRAAGVYRIPIHAYCVAVQRYRLAVQRYRLAVVAMKNYVLEPGDSSVSPLDEPKSPNG